VKQAIASMPSSPSKSPILRSLTYVHDENSIHSDRHGGSDFGGYPSLEERDAAFDIKETMKVHCGLVLFCYLYLIFDFLPIWRLIFLEKFLEVTHIFVYFMYFYSFPALA